MKEEVNDRLDKTASPRLMFSMAPFTAAARPSAVFGVLEIQLEQKKGRFIYVLDPDRENPREFKAWGAKF